MDDTKISHVDPAVVTEVINKLESKFGKMSVVRGDEHVFLGMRVRYIRDKRQAAINMKSYLIEAIDESGLDINRSAATPAGEELFVIDEQAVRLSPSAGVVFHSVAAKLLYVSIRARMDLLMATSFLTTRVSKSTQQDLAKLKRLLEYISGTLDDEYVVGADDLGKLRTWIDASYAVHPDCKSHTGGAMSFGTGALVCKSSKQKLNTKSSTEAELVGASDYLPNTIWAKMFLSAQGYNVHTSILEQDNESVIRLEKNGRSSAGPKSRHINIRYFWLKDRVKSEGITIRHCPTLQMLADFFTKPLQGSLFHRFKAVVLGHQHIDTLSDTIAEPLEERIGDKRPGSHDDTVREYNTGTGAIAVPISKRTYADALKGVLPNSAGRRNKIQSRAHSLERIPSN